MRKPHSAPTFFVDADLGPGFFRSLSTDTRFRVEFHDRHFKEATDDGVWLRFIASKGWIGVTHDKRIKRDHRSIIASAGACVIIVIGVRPLSEQAANFIATYHKIERFVRKHGGPYTAKLYHPTASDLKKLKPTGRIELWG